MPDETTTTNTATGGTPPVESQPNAAASGGAPPPAATRVVGHGGEIPPEKISAIKAEERAAERRRTLKELYGTDDEEQVARIRKEEDERKKKLADQQAEAEKKRLAELSELERTKEELNREREAHNTTKTRLEGELGNHKTQLELERQDKIVGEIAVKYVAPKFKRFAMSELGAHIDGLTKTELKTFDQRAIDKWFRDFVKENPDYKIQAAAPAQQQTEPNAGNRAPARQAAPPPKRAPVGARGTGGQPQGARAPAKPTQASGPGTYKGKRVAELSKKELDEYYKSVGHSRGRPY